MNFFNNYLLSIKSSVWRRSLRNKWRINFERRPLINFLVALNNGKGRLLLTQRRESLCFELKVLCVWKAVFIPYFRLKIFLFRNTINFFIYFHDIGLNLKITTRRIKKNDFEERYVEATDSSEQNGAEQVSFLSICSTKNGHRKHLSEKICSPYRSWWQEYQPVII